MSVSILHGDALAILATLPDASFQSCVTSPPYYGLRDYGVAGQLGLEPTPEEYVAKMVAVFREVRRVLREDGTLWLNIGDSYASGGSGGYSDKSTLTGFTNPATKGRVMNADPVTRRPTQGYKPKDLIGVPWMLSRALRDPYYTGRITDERLRYWMAGLVDGEGCLTILETTSPHGSGTSMPPVLQVRMCDRDPVARCAEITGYGLSSPEQSPPSNGGNRDSYHWRINGRKAADITRELYPYLMVKKRQALVLWNQQLVRESYETKRGTPMPEAAREKQNVLRALVRAMNHAEPVVMPDWLVEPPSLYEPGYYLRSDCIWHKPNPMPESVTDRPTKAHEYVFLMAKAERYYYDAAAIAERGVGRESYFGSDAYSTGSGRNDSGQYDPTPCATRNARTIWPINPSPFPGAHFATMPPALAEKCIRAGTKEGDAVLDPFGGAGTTGLVAQRLGRSATLIELNADYVKLAEKRIRGDAPLFAERTQ